MRKLATRLAFALATFFSAAAHAQTVVRFVRTTGDDANACSLAQPCKTLARGIAAAPAGGEVRVLDSGFFGDGMTIRKSLIISGNRSTVTLAGQLNINKSAASVVLRELMLNGRDLIRNGIVISDAASVHVVGCEVEKFTESGILLDVANTELFVTDSSSRSNGLHGLFVRGDGQTRVTVDNSRFENNAGDGLRVDRAESSVARSTFAGNDSGIVQSGGTMNVTWSIATTNFSNGYFVFENGVMQLESSIARGPSAYGIYVHDGSIARISNLTVAVNDIGIHNTGIVVTRQNSFVAGNQTNTVGKPFITVGAM